jgi:hemolysin III
MLNPLIQILPPDGGLIYTESNFSNFFPEPLNAITSSFFLFIALYWLAKVRWFSGKHAFLSMCSWILLVGGVGGILYHGLRKYNFFIALDWVPIVILCFLTGAWFWHKVAGTTLSVLICLSFFCIEWILNSKYDHDNSHFANNVNYSLMALMILIPVVVYLYKTRFKNGKLILFALITFCLALGFRIVDDWGVFPFGTHFLWHTFSAITTMCLFYFIYKLSPNTIKAAERYSRFRFVLQKPRQKAF